MSEASPKVRPVARPIGAGDRPPARDASQAVLPEGGGFFASFRQPVIACLHVVPLPGSALYEGGGIERVVERALADATTLVEAGVDAILIQNNGDAPTSRETLPETVAYMTRVGAEIRRATSVPLGVNILPNGTQSALSVASAIGAEFVRIKVYVGAVVGSAGLIEGSAHRAQEFVRKIEARSIGIAADVYDRSNSPLGRLPIDEAAVQAVRHGRAGALILTALDTVGVVELAAVVRRRQLGVPIYVGGGTNADNIAEILPQFDGVIVGRTLKGANGSVDGDRVRAYMDAAESVRRSGRVSRG